MLYEQGAIEIDYEDINFFNSFPSITKHITGYHNEKEYYDGIGYDNGDEANQNYEMTWEEFCADYSSEEEVVIKEIKYQPQLILNVKIYKEKIQPELEKLLIKFKIKYSNDNIN